MGRVPISTTWPPEEHHVPDMVVAGTGIAKQIYMGGVALGVNVGMYSSPMECVGLNDHPSLSRVGFGITRHHLA